jgi:DNA-binding NarL/FixJ family response regulator
MPPLRVFLVDDHAIVREGLKALVGADAQLEVVGEAADGPGAIAGVAELDPDVVVMDVSLPGVNGAKATAQLLADQPNRKVVALTFHEEPSVVRLVLDSGASGYVLKRSAAEVLVEAIKAVAAGQIYLDPSLALDRTRALRRSAGGPLSDGPIKEEADALSQREMEVLKLIARGYSNKEVAAKLELSAKTIETYKKRSTEKLGLQSRVDIVRYAADQGWMDSD